MKANREHIAQQAVEWLQRLPSASSVVQAEFLEWLSQSPGHVRAIVAAATLRPAVRKAVAQCAVNVSELIERSRTEDASAQAASSMNPSAAARSVRYTRRWQLVASGIAAATPILALGLALKVLVLDRVFVSGIGESRTVQLTDGSEVKLAPRSRLWIDFDAHERRVRLGRGEAYFKVSKDPLRTFVVESGLADIRALGTQFAVLRREQDVVVTVAEGAVRVSRAEPSFTIATQRPTSHGSTTVAGGEQLDVARNGTLTPRAVDTSRELAWVDDRLRFESGDTLGKAIEEFNRRNRLQISVSDSSLMTWPVRGTFTVNDPRSFVATLTRHSNVSVREERGVLHVEIEPEDSRQQRGRQQ